LFAFARRNANNDSANRPEEVHAVGIIEQGRGRMYVGVDGCRIGWCAVAIGPGGHAEVEVYPTFTALWDAHRAARLILVDIPIELKDDDPDERQGASPLQTAALVRPKLRRLVSACAVGAGGGSGGR